jgi:SAM-dependent methyltransferase
MNFKEPDSSSAVDPPRRAALVWLAAQLAASARPSVLLPLMAGLSTAVSAEDAATEVVGDRRYRKIPPSQDGIGKVYLGREIAGVMGWQGAAWLEREERGRQERGDLLLRALGLRQGMQVADIGAGTGYYARRIAPLLRPGGNVYAVDVQPEMIGMLTDLAKKAGLENVHPVLAAEDDVKLPAASIDLAIMVDVYHELAFPYEVMESIVRALKPTGRVALVEYRAEDLRLPIKPLHKMSQAQIRREAAQHALVYERTDNSLPWQHVMIFRSK